MDLLVGCKSTDFVRQIHELYDISILFWPDNELLPEWLQV
jgi:hypothetical protein